jgi:hypothetical protein
MTPVTPISSAIGRTTLGIDITVNNLTMFPLLTHEPVEPVEPLEPLEPVEPAEPIEPIEPIEPLVLDDSLSSGWAHITEISDAGSVPELRIVNKSDRAIFILDGEELVGAKQNRVVNLSLLVPPQCTLTIPVSCVEAGRWHARSRAFTAAPRAQYAAGRAMRMQHVTESMVAHGVRRSDQSAVWADISEKSERLRARSETGAMDSMFIDHAALIETFVQGLGPVPAQVGAVFAIGERIAGLELFQGAVLLRKLLPKIVRSYALDAIDPASFVPHAANRRRRNGGDGSLRVSAAMFLKNVAASPGKSIRALGLGEDVRIATSGVTAAALVHEERVVHLSAFAA